MAMNGNQLGDEIMAAIDAVVAEAVGNASTEATQMRTRVFRAIGNAIVDHIRANLQITIRPEDAGLQRADGAPTEGPAADVRLEPGNFE